MTINSLKRWVEKAKCAKDGEWAGLIEVETLEGAIDRERAIGAAEAFEAVLDAINGKPEGLAGMCS